MNDANSLVSVIIPAYNEESRLPNTLRLCIEYLQQQNYHSEIIVVTDGSKDNTEEVAQSFCKDYPNLRVLSFKSNRGKGFAVKEGMLAAKGKYRLFMDADFAVPINSLDSFIKKCAEGYDIVIGSRSHKDSKIVKAQEFPRHQLAQIFRLLEHCVLQLPILDTQCGFKLFRDEVAEKLFAQVTYDCAFFDAELLYLAHKYAIPIYEHPVTWTHDPETRLPIGPKRSLELLYKLFQIRIMHG